MAQRLQGCKVFFSDSLQFGKPVHQGRHHLYKFNLIFLNHVQDISRAKVSGQYQGIAHEQSIKRRGVRRAMKQRAYQQLALLKSHSRHERPASDRLIIQPAWKVLTNELHLSAGSA